MNNIFTLRWQEPRSGKIHTMHGEKRSVEALFRILVQWQFPGVQVRNVLTGLPALEVTDDFVRAWAADESRN